MQGSDGAKPITTRNIATPESMCYYNYDDAQFVSSAQYTQCYWVGVVPTNCKCFLAQLSELSHEQTRKYTVFLY